MPEITKAGIHYQLYKYHLNLGNIDWAELHWDIFVQFVRNSQDPHDKKLLINAGNN